MAETIRRVDYFYIVTPDKPGEGARALATLQDAGINLLAFTGFPKGRSAQLDFVPADPAAFVQAAKRARWKLSPRKTAFLVEGEDRVGALADVAARLAAAKINVTASSAICAWGGRYGAIIWVKPRDVNRAAKVLGVS
jgi:hypothetical protein